MGFVEFQEKLQALFLQSHRRLMQQLRRDGLLVNVHSDPNRPASDYVYELEKPLRGAPKQR